MNEVREGEEQDKSSVENAKRSRVDLAALTAQNLLTASGTEGVMKKTSAVSTIARIRESVDDEAAALRKYIASFGAALRRHQQYCRPMQIWHSRTLQEFSKPRRALEFRLCHL